MRGFVAIEAGSAVSERFSELAGELKKEIEGKQRATYPREFHVTLKFLGEFDESPLLLGKITGALTAACAGVKAFSLEARGVGCFPSPNNPRVVFASVEDDGRLSELAERVECEMEKLGFAREGRKFSGHITLARLKEPARLAGFFEKYGDFYFGAMEIKRVKLKKSTLTPSGPVYEDVCSVELRGDE